MILVDISVWIDHFRAGNDRLKYLLLEEQVLCHQFAVGGLPCGNLQNGRDSEHVGSFASGKSARK